MKRIILLALSMLSIILFTGCGTKNIEVKIPKEKLMQDKSKSYIVFSRPSAFFGGGRDVDVMEIDINNLEPIKLVGMFGNGERIIYQTDPGTHYFYVQAVGIGITKIDISKGETKYIDLGINSDLMFGFYPLVLDNNRLSLLNKISNFSCNESFMKRFLMKESVNKENYYKSPLQFEVKCEKKKILEIRDIYYSHTEKELDDVTLVETSIKVQNNYNNTYKKNYTKDLKNYYPIWDFKFKNLPIVESPILLLDNLIDKQYLNKFSNIKVIHGNHNDKMDKELINEYILKLSEKYNNVNKNAVIVRISFDKYDNGSMLKRYLVTGLSTNSLLESMGVIDFNVEIIAEDKIINSFRIFEVEAGGILGGINTLKSDTMKVLTDYLDNNLLILE